MMLKIYKVMKTMVIFRPCLSLDVTVLADHLKNCAKNASYQSKTIQNDIFEMLGGMITEKIWLKLNSFQLFVLKCKMLHQLSK